MISFRDYLNKELNKTTDVAVTNTIVHKVSKTDTLEDIVEKANPHIWTAREINDIKYLIYNNKILNITELKQKLSQYYTQNGYTNYGFAKLSESDLVRYTKVKNIIMPEFFIHNDKNINTDAIVSKLYNNELKNLEWQVEEY